VTLKLQGKAKLLSTSVHACRQWYFASLTLANYFESRVSVDFVLRCKSTLPLLNVLASYHRRTSAIVSTVHSASVRSDFWTSVKISTTSSWQYYKANLSLQPLAPTAASGAKKLNVFNKSHHISPDNYVHQPVLHVLVDTNEFTVEFGVELAWDRKNSLTYANILPHSKVCRDREKVRVKRVRLIRASLYKRLRPACHGDFRI